MPLKSLGIVLVVTGAGIGLWVYSRFTSLYGKMHSWSPPFDQFEITTMITAVVSMALIAIGLIQLTKKSK